MVKRFSKSMEARDELSTTCNPKLCQDACQHLNMYFIKNLKDEEEMYLYNDKEIWSKRMRIKELMFSKRIDVHRKLLKLLDNTV